MVETFDPNFPKPRGAEVTGCSGGQNFELALGVAVA